MARLHIFILSIFILTIQIYGYPNGAPKKACTGSMLPKHHHNSPQPPSTSPITKFDSTWNSDGQTMTGNNRFLLHSQCNFSFSQYRIESTDQRNICPRSVNEWQ